MGKKKIFFGFVWKFLEKSSSQLVTLIVSIIVARALLPEDYGTFAIISVFITISEILIQNGFNVALVQKKNTDDVDYISATYVSMGVAVIIYAVIWGVAPFVAQVYNESSITYLLRVLGVSLFPGAVNSIQLAYISKKMLFKSLFSATLGANMISGVAGIWCAYSGMGVWALVLQKIVSVFATFIILRFSLRWKPSGRLDVKRATVLFSFGWKLVVTNLFETVYNNIYSLIVGKIFDSNILGLFNKGNQIPTMVQHNIQISVVSVIAPIYSQHQNETEKLKVTLRQTLQLLSYFIFPIMIGLAVISEPLTIILLTEKWQKSVIYMQIGCMSSMFMPLSAILMQAIIAQGRSDVCLRAEVIRKIPGVMLLLCAIPFGVVAMAMALALSNIINFAINAYLAKKYVGYEAREMLKDILGNLFASIIMGAGVAIVMDVISNLWIKLVAGIFVGIVVYLLISICLRMKSFCVLVENVRSIKRKEDLK